MEVGGGVFLRFERRWRWRLRGCRLRGLSLRLGGAGRGDVVRG